LVFFSVILFEEEKERNRKGNYRIYVNGISLVQWFRQEAYDMEKWIRGYINKAG